MDMAKELYEASLAKHQAASLKNTDNHDDSIPSLPSTTKKTSPSVTAAPSLQTPPYITSGDETVRWRQEFVYYRDERKEKKRSPTKTLYVTNKNNTLKQKISWRKTTYRISSYAHNDEGCLCAFCFVVVSIVFFKVAPPMLTWQPPQGTW